MKIEIDKEVDAAYIYLEEQIKTGEAARTINVNGDIILDFDSSNRLVGIEVLNASKNLPKLQQKLTA